MQIQITHTCQNTAEHSLFKIYFFLLMIVRVDDFLHCNVYCIGIAFFVPTSVVAAALFFITVAFYISFDFDFCDTKRERALTNRYCMYFCKPYVSHRINNIYEIGHWMRTREFWWLKRAHNFGCYYYYVIHFASSLFILFNFIGCHWSQPKKSLMCTGNDHRNSEYYEHNIIVPNQQCNNTDTCYNFTSFYSVTLPNTNKYLCFFLLFGHLSPTEEQTNNSIK